MEMSDEGKSFIKRREALVLSPHYDAIGNVYDIGFGHVLKDGEPRVPISEAEAHALFDVDIHYYSDQVSDALSVEVSQPIFDALCSLCYNIGGSALRASSVVAFVNAGMYADACVSFLLFRKSRGRDIDGLLNRRAKEMVMFAEGIYLP